MFPSGWSHCPSLWRSTSGRRGGRPGRRGRAWAGRACPRGLSRHHFPAPGSAESWGFPVSEASASCGSGFSGACHGPAGLARLDLPRGLLWDVALGATPLSRREIDQVSGDHGLRAWKG